MLNIAGLTLNPKEVEEIGQFVMEQVSEKLTLKGLISKEFGVQMKEQVVFAGHFSKTGIADTTCVAPDSGAEMVLTQKYWEPLPVGDRLSFCQATVNGLFKAYFGKITEYKDRFDPSTSDEVKLLTTRLIESIESAVIRLVWFGDPATVAAAAAQAGTSAANVKFYTPAIGLWKRIFDGVTAVDIKKFSLTTQNSAATQALQLTLAAGFTTACFSGMRNLASANLKADPTAFLAVNNAMYENYYDEVIKDSKSTNVQISQDGIQTLYFRGWKVVNMEIDWDLYNLGDFVNETTTNKYMLPNRAILTTPANLAMASLNENDLSNVNAFYDNITKKFYFDFGFTIDTQYKFGNMIVVAY